MTGVRWHPLLAVTVLGAVLLLGSAALGDGGITRGRTRLPATCAEVERFLLQARCLRTLDEVRDMSGTRPERIAPMIYRWRLADGKFDIVTMMDGKVEVISCWGPGR